MAVVMYNLDKVERATYKIVIGGVEHELKEPTVGMFSVIQQIDFQNENAHTELLAVMCPTVQIDGITKIQLSLLIEICFKLIKGDGTKKQLAVEELME